MLCMNCPKREICTHLCPEIQSILDRESKKFDRAYWWEFGYLPETLEFLLNVKTYIGQHTILDTISPVFNEDNIIFIKYLIDNYLPEKQRCILTDYYFNRLNQQQIASKYSVTQPTIFFHLRQGIKNLKKMVKDLIQC